MLNLDFRNDDNSMLGKHLLELLINRALQKDHINICPLTIANELINFLDSIIDHVLKAGLLLTSSD